MDNKYKELDYFKYIVAGIIHQVDVIEKFGVSEDDELVLLFEKHATVINEMFERLNTLGISTEMIQSDESILIIRDYKLNNLLDQST